MTALKETVRFVSTSLYIYSMFHVEFFFLNFRLTELCTVNGDFYRVYHRVNLCVCMCSQNIKDM